MMTGFARLLPVLALLALPQLAEAKGRSAPCTPVPADRTVSLDLRDANVSVLVRKVAELTCTDFILDPDLSEAPVFVVGRYRGDELQAVLQTALRAKGAALVRRAHGYEIIPAKNMTRSTVPTLGPDDAVPSDATVVSKIVRVPAGQDGNALCNYLNIFKSGQGQVHPYAGRFLVITDYADSVRRLMRIMAEVAPVAPAK